MLQSMKMAAALHPYPAWQRSLECTNRSVRVQAFLARYLPHWPLSQASKPHYRDYFQQLLGLRLFGPESHPLRFFASASHPPEFFDPASPPPIFFDPASPLTRFFAFEGLFYFYYYDLS